MKGREMEEGIDQWGWGLKWGARPIMLCSRNTYENTAAAKNDSTRPALKCGSLNSALVREAWTPNS